MRNFCVSSVAIVEECVVAECEESVSAWWDWRVVSVRESSVYTIVS
jgi:hypothetical protein